MYNHYYRLLDKMEEIGALHTLAVESGNKELAKYYSDEFNKLEAEVKKYEERNGLE